MWQPAGTGKVILCAAFYTDNLQVRVRVRVRLGFGFGFGFGLGFGFGFGLGSGPGVGFGFGLAHRRAAVLRPRTRGHAPVGVGTQPEGGEGAVACPHEQHRARAATAAHTVACNQGKG